MVVLHMRRAGMGNGATPGVISIGGGGAIARDAWRGTSIGEGHRMEMACAERGGFTTNILNDPC